MKFCAFMLLLLLFECSAIYDYEEAHPMSPNKKHFTGEQLHLGCFISQPVEESRNYKVKQALAFKDVVDVCNHRLTIYMAVTYEEGSPEELLFYCGNDLLELLDKADNSSCHPCVQDQGLMCGGPARVSLYNLRDRTPLTVVVATSNSILKLTEGNSNAKLQLTYDSGVYGLDFNLIDDELDFVTLDYQILRLRYNYSTHRYGSAKIVRSLSSLVHDVAVNWINDNIYWSYNNGTAIYVTDQYNSDNMCLDGPHDQLDLSIDPFSSLLFFLENGGKFYSHSLKTNTTKHFKRLGRLFLIGTCLSVDVQKKTMYASGYSRFDMNFILAQADYGDSVVKVLYKGPAMNHVRALDVFSGTAVWVDVKFGQETVYTCKLAAKCQEVTQLYSSTQTLWDLKIYHPDKQKSTEPDKPKSTSQITTGRKEVTRERGTTENNSQTAENPNLSNRSSSEEITLHGRGSAKQPPRSEMIVNSIDHDYSIWYLLNVGGFVAVLMTTLIGLFVIYHKSKLNTLAAKANQGAAQSKVPFESNYELIRQDPLRAGRLLD